MVKPACVSRPRISPAGTGTCRRMCRSTAPSTICCCLWPAARNAPVNWPSRCKRKMVRAGSLWPASHHSGSALLWSRAISSTGRTGPPGPSAEGLQISFVLLRRGAFASSWLTPTPRPCAPGLIGSGSPISAQPRTRPPAGRFPSRRRPACWRRSIHATKSIS